MFAQPEFDISHPHNINRHYELFFKYYPDTIIGEGFKRTNQYESLISQEELLKKRNEFWETQIQGDQNVWSKLKEVLEMDEESAKLALQEANIIMVDYSIQEVYDMNGNIYKIPIFLINLPASYNDHHTLQLNQGFGEKVITFKIRSVRWNEDLIVTYNNKDQIDLLINELRNKEKVENVRLFINGTEMTKQYVFGNYNINEESIVQAFLQ